MLRSIFWAYFDSSKNQDTRGLDFSHPRAGHLSGRWLLKNLLIAQNMSPDIKTNAEFGFPETDDCFCSISHTEHVTVAAIAPFPIGIDIENKGREVTKVMDRTALYSERCELENISLPIKDELKDPELLIWTGKEALSKALGLGLQIGFKNLELLFGHIIYANWKSEKPCPRPLNHPELQFQICGDYLICLCSEKEAFLSSPQLLKIDSADR